MPASTHHRPRQKQGKRFFFEKKKQKTFVYCGLRPHGCQRPQDQKFFGYFFSKK